MMTKCLYLACLVSLGLLLSILKAEPPKHKARQPIMYSTLGKASNIYALAFSPDEKRLWTGEEHEPNNRIVEWDLEGKSVNRSFDSGHSGQIASLNYSPSGKYVTIGHLDGFVSVLDRRGQVIFSFKSMENPGATLALVSISEEEEPCVYSVVGHNIAQRRNMVARETSIYYIPADGYRINSAAATRNGNAFVCCSPIFLNVYEEGFNSTQEIKSFNVYKKPCITEVAISDDAATVMTHDYDGDLALFDVKNDKLIKKWKGHNDNLTYCIIPFHGKKWFATGNAVGEIKIWNETGDLLALLSVEGEQHSIAALALTRDNRFLASAGENRPIVVWDLQSLLNSKPAQK